MSTVRSSHQYAHRLVAVEELENRLMLSTVSEGEQFIYREADGTLVRVDLNAVDVTGVETIMPPQSQIELMKWENGDVADMPGLLDNVPIDGGTTYRRLDSPCPWRTGRTGISSLTPSNGVLYGFDANTSELLSLDPTTGLVITNLGRIPDSVEPTFYWSIRAMAVKANGDITAIAFVVDDDAANPPPLPNPAGPFLITITADSLTTGPLVGVQGPLITQGGTAVTIGFTDATYDGVTLLATDGAVIYEIAADGNINGQVTLNVGGMNSIEMLDGTLYGVSGETLYTINRTTGQCTALNGYMGRNDLVDLTAMDGGLIGLFRVGNNRNRLASITTIAPANMDLFSIYIVYSHRYTVLAMSTIAESRQLVLVPGGDMDATDNFTSWIPNPGAMSLYTATPRAWAPSGSGGVVVGSVGGAAVSDVDVYYDAASPLGTFPGGDVYGGIFMDQTPLLSPLVPRQDMGRILVAGSVSGSVRVTGSLDVLEVGFLNGEVHVGLDANNIVVQTDFGGGGADNALITTGGMLREVDVFGNSLGSINSDGGINIVDRDEDLVNHSAEPIWEMEYLGNSGAWATGGQLVTVSNNSFAGAQFLYNSTGTLRAWGAFNTDAGDVTDIYGISLMAGQTIRLDFRYGHVDDPREAYPYVDGLNAVLVLRNAEGRRMGSVGEETVEDQGINSRGWTIEPLTFTAPEAGVYYLQIEPLYFPSLGSYTVFLYDGTPASLGSVHVTGNLAPAYNGEGATYGWDVAVRNGNLGAVEVGGESRYTEAFVIGGGDLVSFRAATIGPLHPNGYYLSNLIISDGNIGMVENTANTWLAATVVAGATDGFYNDNAHLQNLHARGPLITAGYYQGTEEELWGIWTTGGIGTILVDDYVSGATTIHINYDNVGPGARLDLLRVGGDWGGYDIGLPTLAHGINSDIGMVQISGEIFTWFGGDYGPLSPTRYTDGRTVILEDDGGARIKVEPGTKLDNTGAPILVGGEEDPAEYSYYLIPVESTYQQKVGSVVARFETDGPVELVNMTAGNTADIGTLYISGNGGAKLSGVGGINVYEALTAGGARSLENTTAGDLVCGQFDDMDLLAIQGNLGRAVGSLGQWLPGTQAAPAGSQAGYFNGVINGAFVDGNVTQVTVGGWLGDLIVNGRAAGVIVNADGITSDTGYDGVVGVVYVDDLGVIDVGDGLADDGSGAAAMAGIFSEGDIDEVRISGAGKWIEGSILAVDSIQLVVGTGGASLTAIVGAMDLDAWIPGHGTYYTSGWIGDVSFSGPGAIIQGSEIKAKWLGVISTSADSDGILDCWFHGNEAPADLYAIAGVEAGGLGLTYTSLAANGGSIGPIRGVGPLADITGNMIDSTDGLAEISGRRIYDNRLTIPGTVGKMASTWDIFGNLDVSVGAIESLFSGSNFAGNYFEVATEITSAKIGGNFADSTLMLHGPQGSRLGLLDVAGNIGGTITVAGSIGAIYSRNGLISANITTVKNPTSADIDLISTRNGFSGNLSVGGSVGRIESMATLGIDPSTLSDYVPKRFDIGGSLGTLRVGAARGQQANLYTALHVGGSVGTVDVASNIFADIRVNGNIQTLRFSGDMGGFFNLPAATRLGSVTVFGSLTNFTVPVGANLVGDLTIGASIRNLTLSDPAGDPAKGNVLGNITSLYGSIENLTVTNGRVEGNITAALRLGSISIRGRAGDPGNVNGDLTANMGGLTSLTLFSGNLNGDVRALGGDIGTLTLTGGNVAAGSTIQAVGGARSLSLGGDFEGTLDIGGRVTMLNVGGDFGAADLGGGVRNSLILGGGAGTLRFSGDVGNASDSTVWQIGGPVTQLMVNGQVNRATVGIAGDTTAISVMGAVTDSRFSGGYIPGQALQSANMGTFTAGAWNNSQLTLGVGPGLDGAFGTADDVSAAGLSQLTRLTCRGAVAGASAVLVDTGVTNPLPAGVGLTVLDGGQPAPEALGGQVIALRTGRNDAADGVTIILGGPGTGSYNAATGRLVLNDTATGTSVNIRKTGAAKRIDIEAGDDRSLASLIFTGSAQAGNLAFDGKINVVNVAQPADNSDWTIPGGAASILTMAGLNNVDIAAGKVSTTLIRGAMTGGSLTVKELLNLQVQGDLSGGVTSTVGSIGTVNVTGAISAPVTSAGGITSLTAAELRGDVLANGGNIGTMMLRGDLAANVQSALGSINLIRILNGSFGSLDEDMAIRAMTGIGSFMAMSTTTGPQPRYTAGVISTNGKINQISVTGMNMSTRVRAADGINTAIMDDMINGMLASGSDINLVTIRKNMRESDIVSGFDPGDAGFDPLNGGNAATVRIDARTRPQAWVTPGNVDRLAGGDIKTVRITGDMTASSIAAAVGPGNDGWYYTEDDQVRGNGYTQSVSVGGVIFGSYDPTQSFGIYAAGAMPNVKVPRLPTGNAFIEDVHAGGGAPRVAAVKIDDNSLTIALTDDIDISTINNPGLDPTGFTSFEVTLSVNSDFGDADDYALTDVGGYTIIYSHDTREMKMRLTQGTWATLNKGTNFQVRLDGSLVTDKRGNPLDGEKGSSFPSGDGQSGGEFLYRLAYGDSGDDQTTATDLTGGVPILYPNQVTKIRQVMGDNRLPNLPQQDIDYYSIDVQAGDILYFWTPASVLTEVYWPDMGILDPSLTGYGYKATDDGTVRIAASYFGYLGPYELSVMLFNDGNSNFSFEDATQAATPVTWTGNTASPSDELETIIAPDDIDVYNLGLLPAWTRLDVALDTLMVGSRLQPKMAVFNSAGEMVGSVMFSESPSGDVLLMNTDITMRGQVMTTTADTYYLAISDTYPVAPNEQVTGSYDLTVTKTQMTQPAPSTQVVYVNFNGGVADYLLEYSNRIQAYQQPLSAARFGYDASYTQTLINSVMDTIRQVYQDYSNITFTTVRPMTGQYTTIYVSNNYAWSSGLLGLAQKIDTDNRDHSDQCTVFGAEMALYYNKQLGHTIEEIGKALGNTAAHELGHILGLNHVQNEFNVLDFDTGEALPGTQWVMGYSWYYSDDVFSGVVWVDEYDLLDLEFTTKENLMMNPSQEFLIGYQNSQASLWTIA